MAYSGKSLRYGPDYIIPAPFDPRLISAIPPAVAKAAMDSGVARRTIADLEGYASHLSGRLDPVAGWLVSIFEKVRQNPKRMVFAEGEQEQVVRAANAFLNHGLGTPVLIGREENIKTSFQATGVRMRDEFEIHDSQISDRVEEYTDFLYSRLQREGYLKRDCQRMVNTDRNIFGACMVALGHADAMVTGVTRSWSTAYDQVRQVLDPMPGHTVIGISIVISRGRAVLVADSSVHDMPTSEELANIATEGAHVARRLGYEPRIAMLSYSTFGHPRGERSGIAREAVKILDERGVDFEYDGEMAADVALSPEAMSQFPFCRLSDTANVLVMPAFHSASISTKMLQELGGATVIGPMLVGLSRPVQIVSLGAKDRPTSAGSILNMMAKWPPMWRSVPRRCRNFRSAGFPTRQMSW